MSPIFVQSFWNMTPFNITNLLENNSVEVKFQGALDVVDYYFITTFNYNFELV